MRDALTPAAELLKALGHTTRLAILMALAGGECSVGELEQVSGIGQPALSQQLAVLRGAALVRTRRESKMVFYRIDGARLGEVSALLERLAGGAAPGRQVRSLKEMRGGAAAFARVG